MAPNNRLISFILVLAVLALWACGNDPATPAYTDITPQGYKVNIPNSVYEHGLYINNETLTDETEIRNKLLYWIDYRVNQWADAHPERDKGYLDFVARTTVIEIIDHFGFLSRANAETTGLTTGRYRKGHIKVTIYTPQRIYDDNLSYNYPPHLIFTGAEMVDWTGCDYWSSATYVVAILFSSIGFDTLPHELDHAIGINHPN